MRVLFSTVAGLMFSFGAMHAAHAADCSTKKEYLSKADVSKAIGMDIVSVEDEDPSCIYSTAPDKSGVPAQVGLSRMDGHAKMTFDAMIQAMTQQGRMTCSKIAGIGDDSRLCMPSGAAIQATIVTVKGDKVYTTTYGSPAAVTDKAVAAKLPDATKALATAFVAK